MLDTVTDDYANVDLRIRERAPMREDVEAITDRRAIKDLLTRGEDYEISLKTQLEFSDFSPSAKHNRIAALILWRQALNHAKRRLVELNRADNEAKKAGAVN